MKIAEQYIIRFNHKHTLLYKCLNGNWYLNRPIGNASFNYELVLITETTAMSFIEEQKK